MLNTRKIFINQNILIVIFFILLFLFGTANTASAVSFGDIGNGLLNAAGKVLDVGLLPIAYLMWGLALGIGGLVTGLGGLALDYSIYHTILQMGSYLNATSGLGGGIYELWSVVRDILNILFIFGLIHVGIKTILDAHNSETHRILGRLIVAALLVNFSLYITQVIIDFTNILSVQIYNQIVVSELTKSFSGGPLELGTGSITGSFLQLTNMTTFFGGNDVTAGMTNLQSLIFAIFTLVFLVFAGLVFGLAAFLLISRFVALIIFMILSPMMFAGWVFPALEEHQNEWRSKFIQYALFPPALLLMIYLSLMVLNKMHDIFLKQSAGFTGAMTGAGMTSETITLIMFFCIAFGFLYASIKIANSMGIAGAETSMHFLNEARGLPVGWGLSKVVKRIDKANQASENPDATAWQKRRAMGLRLITGGEDGRQKMKKISDDKMGVFGKDHITHAEHARKQRATRAVQVHNIEHALELPNETQYAVEKEKAMRDASSAQLIEMIEHHQEQLIINNAGLLSDSQMTAIMKDDKIDDATKGKIGASRGAQTAERLKTEQEIDPVSGLPMLNPDGTPRMITKTMPEVIGKADTSDLKAMGVDVAKENARHLTAKQIDDWKDLTPSEKKDIKNARNAALISDFNADPEALFKSIKSDEEKSKLPSKIIMDSSGMLDTNNIPRLNTNVLAKLVDNNSISDQQRRDIKDNIMNQLNRIGANNQNHPQHDVYTKYNKFFDQNNAGQRY